MLILMYEVLFKDPRNNMGNFLSILLVQNFCHSWNVFGFQNIEKNPNSSLKSLLKIQMRKVCFLNIIFFSFCIKLIWSVPQDNFVMIRDNQQFGILKCKLRVLVADDLHFSFKWLCSFTFLTVLSMDLL